MFVKSLIADLPPNAAEKIWRDPVIRWRHLVREDGYGRHVVATTYDGQTTIELRPSRFELRSRERSFHYGLLKDAGNLLHRVSGLGHLPIYLDEAAFPVYVEFVGPMSGMGYTIAWPPSFDLLIDAVQTRVPGQHQHRIELLQRALDCSHRLALQLYRSFTGVCWLK